MCVKKWGGGGIDNVIYIQFEINMVLCRSTSTSTMYKYCFGWHTIIFKIVSGDVPEINNFSPVNFKELYIDGQTSAYIGLLYFVWLFSSLAVTFENINQTL